MTMNNSNFKIFFTNEFIKEMDYIYNYISKNLYSKNSAKKLMKKVEDHIENLKFMPKSYAIVKEIEEINLEYRRIVIDNYSILYTISESENTIYVVHMYYNASDYLNKI